ncbi:MAG: CDP-diacylglycerol--glycerol-3-phosphate 3-phosphatidyltransferase [Ruminococcus sp.]|uniref:CDP-diacylglycerol--glycerol-3-phosphate 3-phosphatidyltransferase n=1 Tax=Ruminococcus sp. TaxID=41978 RepID=UPI0025FFAF69|nr:CDP-diacylglycerol--glycerol-3-phosphate 3-phosphatidyltransferase [Ruminococcus sp.]MCR5600472.1 CDP-diacylglycerol--glycerol-3-phosphate 3-phosphatidyltransferase [Ruminococcus sp.]
MNLPNKLTLLRVVLIPFFLLFMYLDIPYHFLIALLIFSAASITDALDGKIARARNLVTNFGKFLDPLADKVLVIAALTVCVEFSEVNMSAIPLIIIIAREFMVSGLRLLAANSGIVVAAGIWGKLKTAFTMVAIVVILLWLSVCYDFDYSIADSVKSAVDNVAVPVLIWISTVLTIISGGVYLKGYWHLIDSDK